MPSGVLALLAIVAGFCCVKQRALGRRERALEDAAWEKTQAEALAFRRQVAGAFGVGHQSGYEQLPRSPMMPH